MIKRIIVLAATLAIVTPAWAGGGQQKPLEGTYPIVLAHGLLGWGEESTGLTSIINYWGGMDEYLRSEGVDVYAPAQPPGSSNALRGEVLNEKIRYWMAANGYSKVHTLGHSQGPLGLRYAVSNLGLSSKVASVTSLNGVNKGTGLADGLAPLIANGTVSGLLETFIDLLYAVNDSDAQAVIDSLSTPGMAIFNANTPNAPGVRYYSYGSVINGVNLIQHPVGSLLYHFTGDQSAAVHGYANDGFVPLSSMKWGEWKGGPSTPWYSTGVDHLQCANTLYMGESWFDVEGYFLKMAKNMKAGQ